MTNAGESPFKRRRRERIEERAREILSRKPEPRPGESYDEFAERNAEWSETVSRGVSDPELAAEIIRQSDAEAAELLAQRVPEGEIPIIYESFGRFEPGLEGHLTKRAGDILAAGGVPLDRLVGLHLANTVDHDNRHMVGRYPVADDAVKAWVRRDAPSLMLIWARGELGEE